MEIKKGVVFPQKPGKCSSIFCFVVPLQIALVGLPNVGKSTLFNALTKSTAAAAENFPFCTIDPNVGIVALEDERLNALSKTTNTKRIVP